MINIDRIENIDNGLKNDNESYFIFSFPSSYSLPAGTMRFGGAILLFN